MPNEDKPESKFKIWKTAVRPFAYTATVSAVVLGLAIAHFDGFDINWPYFFITLIGVVCFHTAGNLINDVVDHKKGVDTMVFPIVKTEGRNRGFSLTIIMVNRKVNLSKQKTKRYRLEMNGI